MTASNPAGKENSQIKPNTNSYETRAFFNDLLKFEANTN